MRSLILVGAVLTALVSSQAHAVSPISCEPFPPPTSPPPGAANNGLTNLAFDDEFSGSSLNTTLWTATIPSTDYKVAHGCLTILSGGQGNYSWNFNTNQTFSAPYYAEVVMAYPPNGSQGDAWPAFWSYATQGEGSLPPGTQFAEFDYVEAYPTGSGVTLLDTIHNWTTSTSCSGYNTCINVQNNPDIATLPYGFDPTQYNLYGALVVKNPEDYNKWQVTWFINDQYSLGPIDVGPGTDFPSIIGDNMVQVLGTGENWPLTVNRVNIWTAP